MLFRSGQKIHITKRRKKCHTGRGIAKTPPEKYCAGALPNFKCVPREEKGKMRGTGTALEFASGKHMAHVLASGHEAIIEVRDLWEWYSFS